MNLVNTYTNVGQTDMDNMQLTLDYQRRGYHQVTLTEMDTTTIPQITAGSMVEVGGSLYQAASAESISGSATTGTNYIYLVPGSGVVTPTWTTTAPTWSDAKQGWYGTGGSASYRYIEYKVEYDGASAYQKSIEFFKFYTTNIFAYRSSDQTGLSSGNTIIFNSEDTDIKGEYNTTTGITILQNSGYYQITACIQTSHTNGTCAIELRSSSGLFIRSGHNGEVGGSSNSSFLNINKKYFDSGETLYFTIFCGGTETVFGSAYRVSYANITQVI